MIFGTTLCSWFIKFCNAFLATAWNLNFQPRWVILAQAGHAKNLNYRRIVIPEIQ